MTRRKIFLLLIVAIVFLSGCGNSSKKESSPQIISRLEKLNEDDDYFRLKEVFNGYKNDLSIQDSLYYEAIINNAFINPWKSNQAISQIINNSLSVFRDSLKKNLYMKKLVNHINLYQYNQAAQTSQFIRDNFSTFLDSSELSQLNNTEKMWSVLKDVPEQTVIRNEDFIVPMSRDKIGLLNIDAAIGDSVINLIFDTGANFSTLRRSYVEKLGLELIETDMDVASSTGKKVKANLAVADSLSIGGLTFQNVVFLVVEDENLSFPQIDYYIKGIIGFPVIRAMEEIHITKDSQLFIPKKLNEYSYNNFALSGLMPIVAVFYKGDTLRFHFDTGAAKTSLYALFYESYKDDIEKNYRKETFSTTGAGGAMEFEGYIINNLDFTIADSHAKLDSLKLPLNSNDDDNYYGNLGQDFIKKFDEMIISFKYSSICFE